MNNKAEIQKTEQFNLIAGLEKFESVDYMTRDQLVVLTSNFIASLVRRISGERFREQDGDRMRVTYCRLLVSALQVYAGILKDRELDDLKRRIETLEFVRKEAPR